MKVFAQINIEVTSFFCKKFSFEIIISLSFFKTLCDRHVLVRYKFYYKKALPSLLVNIQFHLTFCAGLATTILFRADYSNNNIHYEVVKSQIFGIFFPGLWSENIQAKNVMKSKI